MQQQIDTMDRKINVAIHQRCGCMEEQHDKDQMMAAMQARMDDMEERINIIQNRSISLENLIKPMFVVFVAMYQKMESPPPATLEILVDNPKTLSFHGMSTIILRNHRKIEHEIY